MRSPLKQVALVAVAALVGIQLIPVNRRNAAVNPAKTINLIESVPPQVQAVLQRSCGDCHSNQTVWPWYAYIAPTSWMVAQDVHQARAKMNFSEWGTYSPKKRADRLEMICDQILNDEMPDGKYALIHRKARLTQEERETVCAWTQKAMATP
ncbi:MAG TPA: heme-binding domain-containing protein [Terriglobales bacterium]|nr:heme-binding domain-containing protein [Terriglobales bacterium]